MLRKSITVLLTVGAVAFVDDAYAFCLDHPNVADEYAESEVVIVGEVIEAKNVLEPGDFIAGTFYTIRIGEIIKGHPVATAVLYAENSSGRFPMEVASTYLVFAYRGVFDGLSAPQLAINNCGHSGILQESIQALDEARRLMMKPNK